MQFDDAHEYEYEPSSGERLAVRALQAQGAPKDVKYIYQVGSFFGGIKLFRFTSANMITQDFEADMLVPSYQWWQDSIKETITIMGEKGMLGPVTPIIPPPRAVPPPPVAVDEFIGIPAAGHPGYFEGTEANPVPAKGTERLTPQGKFVVEMLGTPPMAMMLWKKVA